MKKAEVAKVGQFVRHHRHGSLSSGTCPNVGEIRRVFDVNRDGAVKVGKSPQWQKPPTGSYVSWLWTLRDYEILSTEETTFFLLSGEI